MFSYLRPAHARRNASSTSLVSPDPSTVSVPPLPSPAHQPNEPFTSPRLADSTSYTSSSPVSPYPPQLPPIPRVASRLDKHSAGAAQPLRDEDVRPASGSTAASQPLREQLSPKSQTSLMSGLGDKLSSTPKPMPTPVPLPQKAGRSRLNLRNPMSLLMRRRSGQTLEQLSDESLVTHRSPSIVPPIPDNYDPSIRGRIVHDFSAPRPARNFANNRAHGSDQSASSVTNPGEPGRTSPPKIEREHTPVFREHFDDDTSYEQSQAAIRAEQLANKDFVARNSWQPSLPPPPPGRSPPPPPPLPKDSPPPPPPPPSEQPRAFESSILSPVQETTSPTDGPTEETPRKRKSAKTPPPSRSRAASVTDPSFTPAGLPAHLTSRSSRFSFQIAGNDSSQERILEERHKKKAAENASKQAHMSTTTLDDEYDEYAMDDYDMGDGLEEEIPMIGDDDGFGDPSISPGMAAFDFSSLGIPVTNHPMSPVSLNGDLQTPRDAHGNQIGFALSEDALQRVRLPVPGRHVHGPEALTIEPRGLGLIDVPDEVQAPSKFTPADTPEDTGVAAADESSPQKADLDDDLYFDDGMIEEQGDCEVVDFDEDVFDDPSGPLFDRKVRSPSLEERLNALHSHPLDILSSDTGYDADEDDPTRHFNKTGPSLAHKTSMAHQRPVPDFTNINAYHSALADAANRAEAEGRFARKQSTDVGHISDVDDSSLSNSRPSLIPDDGRFSQETTGFPPDDDGFGMDSSFVDDYDYSDYDSTLEDDPMIAAANAEALANDYDGFYGQEFGFYASAQGEAVNAYGGFFGPSGLGRSISGRNAVREPNLTPITERSEYSTRNSFISISHFRDGQQPVQSPGLAQLARMSPYGWREDDPDMNLDALMKLRKGAFGGSTVSLGSSTGNSPRNSSPAGMQFMPRTASPMTKHPISRNDSEVMESDGSAPVDDYDDDGVDDDALDAINAIPNEYDEEEAEETKPESPTLTASDYKSLSSPTAHHQDVPPLPQPYPQLQALKRPPSPLTLSTSFHPLPPQSIDTSLSSPIPPSATGSAPRRQSLGLVSPISTTSPITPGGAWKGGHSRKGSAADSVAYVREHDEQGGDRWVLERRRTAESGELELVGREIVEGGRI